MIIPRTERDVGITVGQRKVKLTNLDKMFWTESSITKGDLLQYYADVAPVLLPHLRDRAMVMKRYPNGAAEKFFFMKRAPSPRPEWTFGSRCSQSAAASSSNVFCDRARCSRAR